MLIVSLLRWWYGEGLLGQMKEARRRITATLDYFSFTLLLRTLFNPFKQISVGSVRGPLGVKLRAFLDRLVSRGVGASIRSIMIVIGVGGLFLSCLLAAARLAGWLLLPTAPLVGLVLSLSGWVPWKL